MPEISLPRPRFDEAETATDGSGLKASNAGEYRILKYGDKDARKKHLVIVTADVRRKKLLCVTVRIEGKGYTEASIALQHILSITERGIGIKKFYGDGAFDQSSMFNKLQLLHSKSVIKIWKNASADLYRKGASIP
ncbi:MAG: hypothetical protein QXZ17_14535 [Nitrososphaerota archaeon]